MHYLQLTRNILSEEILIPAKREENDNEAPASYAGSILASEKIYEELDYILMI